jgi:hypothetical protein
MTPRIMIATPVMASVPGTGTVTVHYQIALMRTAHKFHQLGYHSSNAFVNTDLVRARSRAVRAALDGCYTHLLFWDSDVGGNDVSTCLQGMLDTGADVVAAPYPRKNGTGRMTHEPPFVAMGFTLLSERCMRKMWDAYYDELYFEDVIDAKPIRTVAMFQLLVVEIRSPWPHRALLGEDYSFCERWLRLDETISLYEGPGAPLEHVGSYMFTQRPEGSHG